MTAENTVPPSLERKIRREKRTRTKPGFPKMGSAHYLEWMSKLHTERNPALYFEIGTESGASLSLAQCASIAVDPKFIIEADVIGKHPELHLFQQKSDSFFETNFMKKLGQGVDLAFLDGMHLIEYLLRDLINIEQNMMPGGLVLVHDCIPMSFAAAERNWDRKKTRAWTGDIWKILPILRKYRPDLKISTLDLAPSGLLLIENHDPNNTILTDNYQKIVDEFVPLSLEDYGLGRLTEDLQLQPAIFPVPVPNNGRWEMPLTPNLHMLRIAIKTPKALKKNAGKIVDHAFARGIADGLLQKGHAVRIDSGADWYVDTQGTDFDLLLRGRGGFTPQPGIPLVSWVIYPGKTKQHRVTKKEVAGAEHTFFASVSALEEFRQMGLGNKCSLLLQGFDPSTMYPATVSNEARLKTVMVGSNHFEKNKLRPIVAMALAANIDLSIWGRGWADTIAEPYLAANYLKNSQVGVLYRSSKIVLCDHLETMRTGGYISNRIFDALACGAAVISDDIEGLPDDIRDCVRTVSTPAEFASAVEEIEAEGETQKLKRHEMAVSMAGLHSFSARADQISKTLIEFKQKKEISPQPRKV